MDGKLSESQLRELRDTLSGGRAGVSKASGFIQRLMAENKKKHTGNYKNPTWPLAQDSTMNKGFEFKYGKLANKSQGGENKRDYGASPFITKYFAGEAKDYAPGDVGQETEEQRMGRMRTTAARLLRMADDMAKAQGRPRQSQQPQQPPPPPPSRAPSPPPGDVPRISITEVEEEEAEAPKAADPRAKEVDDVLKRLRVKGFLRKAITKRREQRSAKDGTRMDRIRLILREDPGMSLRGIGEALKAMGDTGKDGKVLSTSTLSPQVAAAKQKAPAPAASESDEEDEYIDVIPVRSARIKFGATEMEEEVLRVLEKNPLGKDIKKGRSLLSSYTPEEMLKELKKRLGEDTTRQETAKAMLKVGEYIRKYNTSGYESPADSEEEEEEEEKSPGIIPAGKLDDPAAEKKRRDRLDKAYQKRLGLGHDKGLRYQLVDEFGLSLENAGRLSTEDERINALEAFTRKFEAMRRESPRLSRKKYGEYYVATDSENVSPDMRDMVKLKKEFKRESLTKLGQRMAALGYGVVPAERVSRLLLGARLKGLLKMPKQ